MSRSQAFDQLSVSARHPPGTARPDLSLAHSVDHPISFVPASARYALLRQHGTFSLAYSAAFAPGPRHFGDERGFIAYTTVWGTAMALADPIAPPQNVAGLIGRFVREHPDAAFWQISRPTAQILAARGFLVNDLGVETWLSLPSYSFEGQRRRNLRKAKARMARLGYVTRECSLAELRLDEVKAVSEAWKRSKIFRKNEVAFLNRPVAFSDEPDVRRFFAFDPEGRLAGFGFFDPIYDAGRVVGYSTSNTRYRSDVDVAVGHALKRFAIEVFQSEGKQRLSLGLAPAAHIQDKDFTHDWLVRRSLRFAYTSGLFNRFVYPFRGHALHKWQFAGEREQTYMAFNSRPGFLRLIKLLRACRMI